MSELQLIDNSELSISEQELFLITSVRELHNTINSGNIYSFKKIITKQNEEGDISIELQKFSKKTIEIIIEKSLIKQSLGVSGFKLYYSKNNESILKIDNNIDIPHDYVPITADGTKISIFLLLYTYIKNDLNKNMSTDIFNIKEFDIFDKDLNIRLDDTTFKISKELKDFIVKDDSDKNLFFFNDIFIDFVEHIYLKLKEIEEGVIKNED
jgi:hypothetical protein